MEWVLAAAQKKQAVKPWDQFKSSAVRHQSQANFKTSPTDSKTERELMEWVLAAAQKKQPEQDHAKQTLPISVPIST